MSELMQTINEVEKLALRRDHFGGEFDMCPKYSNPEGGECDCGVDTQNKQIRKQFKRLRQQVQALTRAGVHLPNDE